MHAQAKPLVSDEHLVHVLGTAAVVGECAICCYSATLCSASFSCVHTPVCCKDCLALALDFAVESRPYMKTTACPWGCKVITMI